MTHTTYYSTCSTWTRAMVATLSTPFTILTIFRFWKLNNSDSGERPRFSSHLQLPRRTRTRTIVVKERSHYEGMLSVRRIVGKNIVYARDKVI